MSAQGTSCGTATCSAPAPLSAAQTQQLIEATYPTHPLVTRWLPALGSSCSPLHTLAAAAAAGSSSAACRFPPVPAALILSPASALAPPVYHTHTPAPNLAFPTTPLFRPRPSLHHSPALPCPALPCPIAFALHSTASIKPQPHSTSLAKLVPLIATSRASTKGPQRPLLCTARHRVAALQPSTRYLPFSLSTKRARAASPRLSLGH